MVYIAESYETDLTKRTEDSYLRLKIVIIMGYFFELTRECWIVQFCLRISIGKI